MGVPSVTTLVLEWEVVVERDLGDGARGKKMTGHRMAPAS